MTDLSLHYRLLADALPGEEKRIRSSYVPSLVLVMALSPVVFVTLGIIKGATSKLMIQYGLIIGRIHGVRGSLVPAQNEEKVD